MTHDIANILKDMRKAVIHGDYGRLADLIPALETAEPESFWSNLSDMGEVKLQADQTAACLQAAVSGIKSARRRLSEILEAEKGLTTYDRTGAKATVSMQPPVSRRV